MIPKLFLSYRMDSLVDQLLQQIEENPLKPLEIRTILVPNGQTRQWLLLEIAKRKGIAMGLKILEIEQLCPTSPNSLEMFCLIYAALSESSDPQLVSYLDGKKKRLLDLAGQLRGLFFKYGEHDASLFEGKAVGWQHELLRKLFVDGPWRLPVQQEMKLAEPIICFGIDALPPVYWEFLFSSPSLSIYLFSPCVDFWADLCSDRERKSLNRYWKKRGAAKTKRDQLDAYLREAPKNLANWGRLGRETLKLFDRFDLETEEVYPHFEPSSLLKQIQFDLLTFQETKNPQIDDSIKVVLTGSSRLKEIEALRDEILRLKIPYHEISVLAPDIEPYVPLIEFVFGNDIPYRISGFDGAPQSSFRQGMVRLLRLSGGRWEAEEVLSLFETPAFYRKQGWDPETLEEYRAWIEEVNIDWGLDKDHRKAVMRETLGERSYEDRGSWENGLDQLLEAVVYLKPMQINGERFDALIGILSALRSLELKGEKSLTSWADSLENVVNQFLIADPNDEADTAVQNSFRQFLLDLRNFHDERPYSFDVVQHLLIRPCKAQIHSSHLHAVRFAPIVEGASLPAKALFLIGMDEESFPRVQTSTSLDLLRQKTPDVADQDRYLFLQALFSAEEFLRISYGHLSADEGKPVGPSLLVQELLSVTGPAISTIHRSSPLPEYKKSFVWPPFKKSELPEGEVTLSISELRQLARHPWKFFLQKRHGIYLKDELEESFALQKGLLLRSTLGTEAPKLPPGPFGKAIQLDVSEKAHEWRTQLEVWQIEPFSLHLRENCTAAQWEGPHYIVPPLVFSWDKLTVRLVGEVKQVSTKGLISANEDNLTGTLKVWPEALAAALSLNVPQICMLRNGKIKSIENPNEHLKAFIEYYFHCLNAPSPLISDWADPILRKGVEELAKKMERGALFEDPAVEWVLSRAEIATAEEMFLTWGSPLRQIFSGLIELYPTKKASAPLS
jgi:exodeoxyribonuclease V gamma subunit